MLLVTYYMLCLQKVDSCIVVSNVISDSSIFTSLRCYYFGDISSKRDPTAYLNYIFALYDYYRREYCMLKGSKKPVKTELPLVVNTPGWVKGELTFSISPFYHIIWASLLQTYTSSLLEATVFV